MKKTVQLRGKQKLFTHTGLWFVLIVKKGTEGFLETVTWYELCLKITSLVSAGEYSLDKGKKKDDSMWETRVWPVGIKINGYLQINFVT